MVTIVYLILCWCGVFDFSWWFPFIESIILLILELFIALSGENTGAGVLGFFQFGLLIFSFYKVFADIAISNWFILLTPLWAYVAALVPGGTTISNILLHNAGLMLLPKWFFIVGIVLDAIEAFAIVFGLLSEMRDKNKNKN